MDGINDACFTDPTQRARFLRFARGFDPSTGRLVGGIVFPEETKLRPGRRLYRFGHSTGSRDANLSSPWWMSSDAFEEIVARARATDGDLVAMNRIKNAVSHDFGVADTIYCVEVVETLRAFTGRGRPVVETGMRPGSILDRVLPGGFEIAQLFIPGLRDPGGTPSAIARRALRLARTEPAAEHLAARAARLSAALEA